MNNKIKSAFDQIHAEYSLKAKTKTYVYEKSHCHGRQNTVKVMRFSMAVVCFFAVMFGVGGYFSYTTSVAAISIDINPSVELKINMYDKVIDVRGYNEDGIKLSNDLDIKYMDYSEAINAVLANEMVVACLSDDNVLEITVAADSEKVSEKMQRCISSSTGVPSENIFCCGNQEDVAKAHSAGLSFGKYRAFLELQKINPDITVEDIKGCTMHEIRDMISGEETDSTEHRHGYGKGYHHRNNN